MTKKQVLGVGMKLVAGVIIMIMLSACGSSANEKTSAGPCAPLTGEAAVTALCVITLTEGRT